MIRFARAVGVAILALMLTAVPACAQPPAQNSQPPASQDKQSTTSALEQFVPIDQLPPGQELPAAPFLVGAYAFFLVLMTFYMWTVWRRIGKVEQEMHDLQRRQGGGVR